MAHAEAQQLELLKEFREAESAHYRHCKLNRTAECYYNTKPHNMAPVRERDAIRAQFKGKGLKLREGGWTLQEKKLLNKNFGDFVREHGERIGDPVDFITLSSNRARVNEVRKLKDELEFIEALGRGLYRVRNTVRSTGKVALDPLAVGGGQRFSVEDIQMLKKLIERHGRNWLLISKEIGRSAQSLRAYYTSFLLYEGYDRKTPTKKQQRKLAKEILKRFPEHDFSTELVHDAPWGEIAIKIGYMHGDRLKQFWEQRLKYHEDGKLKLKGLERLSNKMVRKFIRIATKKAPTHLDALDWDYFYAMFGGKVAGIFHMRGIIRKMLKKYKINEDDVGLAAALVRLHNILKQQKKLGFQSVWDEIKGETLKVVRWQQYHWALSPDLAHYVQNRPVMYWGYQEDHSDVVKSEPVDDPDIVW